MSVPLFHSFHTYYTTLDLFSNLADSFEHLTKLNISMCLKCPTISDIDSVFGFCKPLFLFYFALGIFLCGLFPSLGPWKP